MIQERVRENIGSRILEYLRGDKVLSTFGDIVNRQEHGWDFHYRYRCGLVGRFDGKEVRKSLSDGFYVSEITENDDMRRGEETGPGAGHFSK